MKWSPGGYERVITRRYAARASTQLEQVRARVGTASRYVAWVRARAAYERRQVRAGAGTSRRGTSFKRKYKHREYERGEYEQEQV